MSRSDNSNFAVALTNCYFCGEGNTIVMNRRLTPGHARQVEELNHKVVDMTPCSKCEDLMKRGIILITIDDAKSEKGWNKQSMPNPYRTGGFFVITEEAFKKVFHGDIVNWALQHRWMFIEHEAAVRIGLFEFAPNG